MGQFPYGLVRLAVLSYLGFGVVERASIEVVAIFTDAAAIGDGVRCLEIFLPVLYGNLLCAHAFDQ